MGDISRSVSCPVVHFKPSPEARAGSHWERAKELREMGPILFNTEAQGYWVVTSYELVREMYANDTIYSAEAITPHEPNPEYRLIPLNMNPPESISYRRLLNHWFSPKAVKANEASLREICVRHVSAFAANGACEAVADFALLYPTEASLKMMNLPTSDTEYLVGLVDDFFSGFGGNDPEKAGAVGRAMHAYYRDQLLLRKSRTFDPSTDIMTDLMHAEIVDGKGTHRRLTDGEVIDMFFLLTTAGLDTVRSQIGWMLYHFATHPEDLRTLRRQPELMERAVEEVIRYYTIIRGDARKVRKDVEVEGCLLKRGDMVYGMASAANRDDTIFDSAESFVIDRKPAANIAFAAGAHRCVGSHLARLELKIALKTWIDLIGDWSLGEGDLMEHGAQVQFKTLPLRWGLKGERS